MTDRSTHIRVSSDRGVFMISVAAELAEMHPQTLRIYEARGLIEPHRSAKGTRLYSLEDVERLRRIQQMTAKLGLNLAGVERVLELEEQLDAARARLEDLERQALVAKQAMEDELDRVRRSVRFEVVPYTGSTALVRSPAADPPFRVPVDVDPPTPA
ncbi:MAG: MerR family transcriptional regulator, heat shock protein HspR [Solirubrobacteraceae bacterium]|nr:MerR family transcriptional regulator, heat shock protein HspR [Solirubrobacteraceae bacterium]